MGQEKKKKDQLPTSQEIAIHTQNARAHIRTGSQCKNLDAFHTLKTPQFEHSGQESQVTVGHSDPNGSNAFQCSQETRKNTANSTLYISPRRVTFGHSTWHALFELDVPCRNV